MSENIEPTKENTAAKKTTIYPRPNGPLIISGDEIDLIDTRYAICRCGHTGKQPFCDGSHNRMGFKG
jgi:CDGSH-type Zn-finger protein